MKYLVKFAGVALALGLCTSASAAFVLNEVDPNTPGADVDEFIELKGDPNESADGLIIVLFHEDGLSYRTIDLQGGVADSDGYLLVGSAAVPGADIIVQDGFLRNQENAVALYRDSADNFPEDSMQTTLNLLDVVVYESNQKPDQDWSGLGVTGVVTEGAPTGAIHLSVSRIPDGTGDWSPSQITPRAPNTNFPDLTPGGLFLPRYNQTTAQVPTILTIAVENTGPHPMTLNSLDLASTSSAEFSLTFPASGFPQYLEFGDSVEIGLQFVASDVSANKVYNGAFLFTTDNPTSPSGSLEFSTELVIASPSPSPGAVKINEVCYRPGSSADHNNDGVTADQNDEFVELINMTNAPILIEGWEQRCSDWELNNFQSFVFPEGSTIPANGFVTVFTSGNPTGFLPGTTFTYGRPRIRNNGAFVGIDDATSLVDGIAFDGAETASPTLIGYTNTGVLAETGGSIGRFPDGIGDFSAFAPGDPIYPPTPNQFNDPTAVVSSWSLY